MSPATTRGGVPWQARSAPSGNRCRHRSGRPTSGRSRPRSDDCRPPVRETLHSDAGLSSLSQWCFKRNGDEPQGWPKSTTVSRIMRVIADTGESVCDSSCPLHSRRPLREPHDCRSAEQRSHGTERRAPPAVDSVRVSSTERSVVFRADCEQRIERQRRAAAPATHGDACQVFIHDRFAVGNAGRRAG